MNKIHIEEGLSWEQKKIALEMSLLMGFFSISAKFPVVSRTEGIRVPNSLKDLEKIYQFRTEKWPEDYVSATKNARPIMEFDWRKKKGLETLFSKGIFLEDENFDQLPDRLNFKIVLPKDCDLSILTAACNFAFRFGMETTAYEGPIIADENWKGNLIVFEADHTCGMELIEDKDRFIVRIHGQGKELEKFSAYICENFPLLPEGRTWVEQLQVMTESFSMRNLDGQLAYLKAYEEELEGDISAYFSPRIDRVLGKVSSEFPKVKFINHREPKKVYEKTYDIPWEVDVFKYILKEKVYPILKAGDQVEIYGALSEDKDVRHKLAEEIKASMEEMDVVIDEIQIICAYKQGFSWLEEVVLPQLEGKKVSRIEIAFKPFLPEGVTEWLDEDGATPSYHNIEANDPNKWYDVPIRYLQELYPIDDIIAMKLNIDRDRVKFVVYEGEEDITYEVKVYDDKEEILNTKYKAAYSERPYLDEYPQMGKVHPSTGFIQVLVNGNEVVKEYIKTDLENIWNIYQAEVLPACRKFVEEKTKGNIAEDLQPFFSQLRLDIIVSEPDYSLPCREDLISSLDDLHEDIYFVGLDYFKNYGIQKNNVMLDAPGLILPVIKKGKGKPKFKVTLYDKMEKEPCIRAENRTIKGKYSRDDIELYIEKLIYESGQITAYLRTNIEEGKLIKSYLNLMEKQLLEASNLISGTNVLKITNDEGCYSAEIKEYEEIEKDLSILDIDLMEFELIGYEQYMKIIEQLKRVPGIGVYPIARSYQGRDIYAIEILPKEEGYVSRTKRLTKLPSEIINCRHHANEVSSTNAAFILLKKILTDEKYEALPDKLNLVIVPMENVDGVEIHYELQKDNPYWKLHVARFNSVGKEFYYEYFKKDTIHTEAMGFKRLWERHLPDVVVDNHGVPSHEWSQQFSGYTSPSYKGFWLPRSLLYGYFWVVTDEVYKSNYPVNKKIEDVVADKIGEDQEITKWNKEWMSIFEKYAHSWLPKLFPANYYKNMINYWIPFEFEPEHRYPSIRFPWITTVAYTSEVADETAQGEYLNLCARAHVTHDEAIIQLLMDSKCLFEKKLEISKDKISVCCIRHRPIIV